MRNNTAALQNRRVPSETNLELSGKLFELRETPLDGWKLIAPSLQGCHGAKREDESRRAAKAAEQTMARKAGRRPGGPKDCPRAYGMAVEPAAHPCDERLGLLLELSPALQAGTGHSWLRLEL